MRLFRGNYKTIFFLNAPWPYMFGVYRIICLFQFFFRILLFGKQGLPILEEKKWLIWNHLKISLNLVVHLEENEKVFNERNILPTDILQLALLEVDCWRNSNLREDRELDGAHVVTAAKNRHLLVYSFQCDVNASLMPYTNINIHIINILRIVCDRKHFGFTLNYFY